MAPPAPPSFTPDFVKLSALSCWLTYDMYKEANESQNVLGREAITDADAIRSIPSEPPLQENPANLSPSQDFDRYCLETGRTCETRPFYKENGEIAGCVIKTGEEIIVAYRGTMTAEERGNDADTNFKKMTFGSGEREVGLDIHQGFHTEYQASKASMQNVLNDFEKRSSGLPVHFTGHSLGGAEAGIAALDYKLSAGNYEKDVSVISIGAPRCFKADAAPAYNAALGNKTLRVLTQGDLIPKVPPTVMGYAHVGWKMIIPTNWFKALDPLTCHLSKAYTEGLDYIKNNPQEIKASTSIEPKAASFLQRSYLDLKENYRSFMKYIPSINLQSMLNFVIPSFSFSSLMGNANGQVGHQEQQTHASSHTVDNLRHKFHVSPDQQKALTHNSPKESAASVTPLSTTPSPSSK